MEEEKYPNGVAEFKYLVGTLQWLLHTDTERETRNKSASRVVAFSQSFTIETLQIFG
jgi:hypothetical protein